MSAVSELALSRDVRVLAAFMQLREVKCFECARHITVFEERERGHGEEGVTWRRCVVAVRGRG
jgi:hypothetical protein